jgi:hypothetical protein
LLVIITLFLNNYHLNPLSPPNEKTIWNGNFDHGSIKSLVIQIKI